MPTLLLALGVAGCGPDAERGVDLGFPDGQVARATVTDAFVHPPVVGVEDQPPVPPGYFRLIQYPTGSDNRGRFGSTFCAVTLKPHRARFQVVDPEGRILFQAAATLEGEAMWDMERRVSGGYLACIRWNPYSVSPLFERERLVTGLYQWRASFDFDSLPDVSVERAFEMAVRPVVEVSYP